MQPTDHFGANDRPILPGVVESTMVAIEENVELPSEGRILPPCQEPSPADVDVGGFKDKLTNKSCGWVLLIINLKCAVNDQLLHLGKYHVRHHPVSLCWQTQELISKTNTINYETKQICLPVLSLVLNELGYSWCHYLPTRPCVFKMMLMSHLLDICGQKLHYLSI